MKRFLPSSVMLTPFVVKHYQEQEDDQSADAEQEHHDHSVEKSELMEEPS